MATSCSHVLLWVRDLHQAVRDYRKLGFKVDYATAERKAQHAHIWFTEGPVVELLTTPRSARWFKWPIELMAGRGSGRRMIRWSESGEGFCDVAVVTDRHAFDRELTALRKAGVPVGRAIGWRRTKPDGQEIHFKFAYPANDRLPFIVSPYDPPQHPRESRHPNGATRLSRVRMGVRAEHREAARRIVGDDPTFVLEPGEMTGVRAIEITGLTADLDPALLHGAVVLPARPMADASHVHGSAGQ
ncbi:VOC family protein [Sorangium sp. So ce260]|uniref:VOC family protein n=1 Tax=Sorangium sp. So ce260 TaxID=3133291 RepID=UPI003F60C828